MHNVCILVWSWQSYFLSLSSFFPFASPSLSSLSLVSLSLLIPSLFKKDLFTIPQYVLLSIYNLCNSSKNNNVIWYSSLCPWFIWPTGRSQSPSIYLPMTQVYLPLWQCSSSLWGNTPSIVYDRYLVILCETENRNSNFYLSVTEDPRIRLSLPFYCSLKPLLSLLI